MTKRAVVALLLLASCACTSAPESHMKAIIGAVLIDGAGGPPVSNSVVVTAGDRIRAAGPASTVAIPSEADKIDGSGKFLVPALVDISAHLSAHLPEHPGMLIQGRDEDAFAKARESGFPVLGRIASLADAAWMLEHGATGFAGMIRDTEELSPEFVAKLRDLRITFAPGLNARGNDLIGNDLAGNHPEVAKRNTRRLFQAGVPIALASEGGDPLREAELLVEAGIPPLDVVVALTRNGAVMLHDDGAGTIQTGKRANLLLLGAHPGNDIRNLGRVALRMVDGEIAR